MSGLLWDMNNLRIYQIRLDSSKINKSCAEHETSPNNQYCPYYYVGCTEGGPIWKKVAF